MKYENRWYTDTNGFFVWIALRVTACFFWLIW